MDHPNVPWTAPGTAGQGRGRRPSRCTGGRRMVQASVDEPWSVDGHVAGRALEPYVSRLFADWLRTTPHRTHRRVEGTMVFADISGFTRLTERLARLGKVGSEDMSDALDVTFTELLGVADADGADLVKW